MPKTKRPRPDTGKPKPRTCDLEAMRRVFDKYYPGALTQWENEGQPLRHVFHDLRSLLRFIEFYETGRRGRAKKGVAA